MTRWWMLLVFGVVASVSSLPDARAQSPDGDMATWIGDACRAPMSQDAWARLDQVASKALSDHLRAQKFRDVLRIALAYTECVDRGTAESDPEQDDARRHYVRQVLCFVPLVVFESEQKIDRALATSCLAHCPQPPLTAPTDAKDIPLWAESVRRYATLMSAARTAPELLQPLVAYSRALDAAGVVSPLERRAQGLTGTDAPVDEHPDPVLPLRVLVATAAIATGNLGALLDGNGGEDAACTSSTLAGLGLSQSIPLPREAALPLLVKLLLKDATLDAMLRVSNEAQQRFADRKCVLPTVIASLAMTALSAETVDRAVAANRLDDIATLAHRAITSANLPGSADSRLKVMRRLVQLADGAERGRRLCAVGDLLVSEKRSFEAIEAFIEADALLPPETRLCSARGAFVAACMEHDIPTAKRAHFADRFVAANPEATLVYEAISRHTLSDHRVTAVRALEEALPNASVATARAVKEALIKVVDADPGSPAATAAIAAVDQRGGPENAEERLIWGLITARHFILAKDRPGARRALTATFAEVTDDATRDSAREGMDVLLRWLADRQEYGLLDEVVSLARPKKALSIVTLANVAGSLGDVGERKRARRLLAIAGDLGPDHRTQWLAIADARARMDDTDLALAALKRIGPEEDWDVAAWMARGRVDMGRRQYREAVAAYTKAAELDREECSPRYFRGLVQILLGDADGAREDLEACMKLGDRSGQVVGGLAYALFDLARYDEAEARFREAIAKDDTMADNHLGLALTLFRLGRLDEAKASFARAVMAEPAIGKGIRAAEIKGYVYSDVEKKAWDDFVKETRQR